MRSAEEKKEFFLEDCDKYPKLCEGGSSLIGHGHGPEYVLVSENFNHFTIFFYVSIT